MEEKKQDIESELLDFPQQSRYHFQVLSKDSEIDEYKKIVGDINILKQHYQNKILNHKNNVEWTPQFSEQLKYQTIEFDLESLVINAHYGNYRMKITTLMTFFNDEEIQNQRIAEGAFGSIYKIQIAGKQHAIKGIRIAIDEAKINLDYIYKEYFLCSIASFLQAGPKMSTIMGYDIVTFKNTACFSMQLCETLDNSAKNLDIYSQMIENLRAMHSIGLVHLDIKPTNIVYSCSQGKNVFIDFGFSAIIKQTLGTKTYTQFSGTIDFCSDQMKKEYWLGKGSFIDLYYNDLVGLKKSMKMLSQDIQQHNNNFQYQPYDNNFPKMSSLQTVNYLSSIIRICRLKYLIYTNDILKVQELIRTSFYISKTLYIIITDECLKLQLRQSQRIKSLIIQLRANLMKYSFSVSNFDEDISKLLSLKQNPILTPQILTVDYALVIETQKFKSLLNELNFVQRLFIVFDPSSSTPKGSKQYRILLEKNSLRKKLVQKIYECFVKQQKQTLFFEKIRRVTFFFYERLKQLKNRNFLISIRLMFLMLYDFTLIEEIERQICQLTTEFQLKVVKALEFAIFESNLNHIREQKLSFFNSYIGQVDESLKKDKILAFAYKIISLEPYLASKQLSSQIKKQFLAITEENPHLKNEITLARNIFCLSQKIKIELASHQTLTLTEYIYRNNFFAESPNQYYESIASLFSFQFLLEYSSQNLANSIKIYQSSLSKLFKVLKIINCPQARVFSAQDKFAFRSEFELAILMIRMYTQHLNSFNFLNDQQTFESFEAFDWIFCIFNESLNFRRFNPNYRAEDTNKMVRLIQSSYCQLKNNTSRFSNSNWYTAITCCIQGLLCLSKQDEQKLQFNFNILKKVIKIPNKSLNLMIVYLNLIYLTIERSNQPKSKIPIQISAKCQSILQQILNGFAEKPLLILFQKSALLQSLILLYAKKKQHKKIFLLMKLAIKRVNYPDVQLNLNFLQAILKFAVQLFCSQFPIELWIIELNLLRQQDDGSLKCQDIYLQHLLFDKIVRYIHRNQNLSLFLSTSTIILLQQIPFIKYLIRLSKASYKIKPYYFKQIETNLYSYWRFNLELKSRRKQIMCLRRQGQYKLIKLKFLKKLEKSPFTVKHQMKLKLVRLCSIAQLNTQSNDFLVLHMVVNQENEG